jgi:hypothetical protein
MRIATINLIVLIVSACGLGTPPFDLVDEEIISFQDYYKSGNYEAIYSSGSTAFRNAVDASTFENSLLAQYVDLGHYLDSEIVYGSSSSSVKGSPVIVALKIQFERGQVVERLVFVFENGKYRLRHYDHGFYDVSPDDTLWSIP